MSDLFKFTFEELATDHDEPEDAATPYRLTINGDIYDLTIADVAALHVNTHGYLKRLYPRAGGVPLMLKAALSATAAITIDWLQICPRPVTDPRLHNKDVQLAMLRAAAQAFKYCGHNEEAMMEGAVELLQARAKTFPAVKESCQNAVHEVNLVEDIPVKSYQNMLAASVKDQLAEPDFPNIEDALRLDLENALFDCERDLRLVFRRWSGADMEVTRQSITSAEKIGCWFIDQLTQQYDAYPNRHVALTKDMENELVTLSHDFTFRTLTEICERNKVAMLCVSGPKSGELVYPDRHGVPGVRPLALFPLGLFEPDDYRRDT